MNNPLVSICIPVYNGAPFLKECIDSCLRQTYSNYEIIILDDGSTDESVKIIESYLISNNRIRFIKNPLNLGLVGNWNKCINESKGEWIKFVFQDDYIADNCIEEFVLLITNESQLIVSERNFVLPINASEDVKNYYNNTVRTLLNTCKNKTNFYSAQLIARIAVKNMGMNFIGEPSLIFFRKNVVKELGYFNPQLKQICDLEFALRVASVYGVQYIPKQLCAFRIHEDTTTNKNVISKYFELRYLEPLILAYFLLYDEKYTSFRKNIGAFYRLKLKLYFDVKAYSAYKSASSNPKEMEKFNKEAEVFKEINEVKKGNLISRFVASRILK